MTVHNCKSGQVHKILNGLIHPAVSDMRSAKSGPNLWQIWQAFGPWASPYGQMGKWQWQCTATGLDNSTKLRMEKIRQAVTEIWFPQVWQSPVRPTNNTLQPGGLRGNKANLRDLIAATGLVIFLKLDSNRWFFRPCDREIWWMTPKNNRAPLLCYFNLFASFRSHWWIQTGVTVQKHPIWVKIDNFF